MNEKNVYRKKYKVLLVRPGLELMLALVTAPSYSETTVKTTQLAKQIVSWNSGTLDFS